MPQRWVSMNGRLATYNWPAACLSPSSKTCMNGWLPGWLTAHLFGGSYTAAYATQIYHRMCRTANRSGEECVGVCVCVHVVRSDRVRSVSTNASTLRHLDL